MLRERIKKKINGYFLEPASDGQTIFQCGIKLTRVIEASTKNRKQDDLIF